MRKIHLNSIKGLAFSASALALVTAGQAYAQDTDAACPEGQEEVEGECVVQSEGPDGVISTEDEPVAVTDTGATGQQSQGGIVVTGSRIVRDTYSSISPLQVITRDSAQNAGLFDPSQILQRDESAAGTQIDATFQGFVLDNGPGAQTVNLRGLGANRTLLLLNGRRLSPSGVEGAPTAPSTNLLPSSLIDRIDLLLDGASSIYGSDAVAGVGNVILRKDFDGLELFASGNLNEQGGGNDYTVSAAWGFNTDRAFFGIGAEYDYRDEIRLRDRDFLSDCETNYEVTESGEFRTIGLDDQINALTRSGGAITTSASPCVRTGLSGRVFIPFTGIGSIYFREGDTNLQTPSFPNGVPNYNESNFFSGAPVDANGDGLQDVDFQDFNTNGANLDALLIPEQKRYNVMAYGEYTFPGEANITTFFEALYTRVDVESTNTGELQIFPSVPSNNQFNPCNPDAPGGTDCFNIDNEFNGFGPALPFAVPLPAVPLLSIRGDRDNFDIKQEQYRGVFGVKGDLPFAGPSWTFEVSGVYSRSEGTSRRFGIREDKLAFALGIDPTADFNGDGIIDNDTDANFDGVPENPGDGIADDYDFNVNFGTAFAGPFGLSAPIDACDASQLSNPDLAAPDLLDGCVPVNLFAPSVIGQVVGEFATQAEADYVFGTRDFDTTYEQIILSGFVSGDLFELPAGPVGAVFGLEWRKDKINSQPNFVASNGLFFGFFSDRGAVGSKWIREAFAEIDIPLQADKPWVRELNLNLSGRITDEEFYGTEATYSIKGEWRPIDPLALRIGYGTSFRAPNLRENFLLGQTGFLSIVDPCAVPDDAFVGGAYDPTSDTRDQATLDNCVREGRDPTTVGISLNGRNTNQISSVEISSIGSLDLDPETSRSITAGFAFEETFGDGYDVSVNFNYYDIKIKESIVRPGLQFAANDCFTRQDGIRSQFCDQLFASAAPGNLGLISNARLAFLNIDENSVRGIDINADFGKEVTLFGQVVDLGINLRANHLIERSTLFIDGSGQQSFDEDDGEFGFPKWTGRTTFTAEVDRWLFTWQTRYIGDMRQDPDGVDPFADNFGFGSDGVATGFFGDTCTGFGSNGPGGAANPIVPGDGAFCSDVGFANDYFEHSASIRYRDESWEIRVGVTNIFDRNPPLVDGNEVLSVSNVPIGAGYNLDGREYFMTVRKTF